MRNVFGALWRSKQNHPGRGVFVASYEAVPFGSPPHRRMLDVVAKNYREFLDKSATTEG